MSDIVAGLFGLSPYQVQQQRQQQINTQAGNYAQLDPFQKASQSLYQGGAGAAQIGAGMMGMVDPAVQEAQQRQQSLQGLDVSNPESILQRAAQIQDPQLKAQLVQLAQQRQGEIIKQQQEAVQTQNYQSEIAKRQFDMEHPKEGGGVPANIQEYQFAKQNGYKGTFEQWMLNKKGVTSGGATEKPANNLLQKDQRWVKKDGEWVAEIIPGSRTWVAQKDKFAADKNAVDVLDNSFKNTKEKINYILSDENKPAFNNLFGGYNAKYATQYASGKTADVKQKLESLKSEMKASGLQIMRSGGGIGQITEREWKIMENMIDSLDPTMSEDNARKVIEEIGTRMESVSKQGKDKFNTEWSGSQFSGNQPVQKQGGVKFLGFE